MKKHILCLGLFVACAAIGFSQSANLSFKHLSVQDGLSRSWVKCFLEDRTGMLWIGTGDGLNKFDGTHFTIYKYSPTLSRSLNHNNINVVFEDSNARLWVGTQAGLNYYQRESDEFIAIPSVTNYITSIYELKDNTLLLGSAAGLFLFDVATHTAKHLYSSFYVEKILKDNRGTLWLATHTGLMLFDPTDLTARPLRSESGKYDTRHTGHLFTLFQGSRGGLWIGTISEGLCYFTYPAGNPDNGQLISFKPDPADAGHITSGAIYAIAEDEDNNLWVGIENGGINLLHLEAFDRGDFTFRKVVNNPADLSSLSNNSVHALYSDKQHSMWVGTYAGGVNQYNKLLQRFGHQQAVPGSDKSINDKYVSAILDEDDYLWIGTEKGLNRYSKATGRWEYFTHDFNNARSLASNAVLAVRRDSQHRLWVGTYNGGLNLFDEKTRSFTKFRHDVNNPASLSGDNIYQVIESKDHRIWIGLMGAGVAVYNERDNSFGKFQESQDLNALSANWVTDLMEDHLGNIWISTTEAVDRLDPATKHFTTFTHNPADATSINYNGATCLFEDSHHTVWMGTSNGLNYFVPEDNSFRHYTVEDGLPNNFIKAITEDDAGNIWFSTNNTLTVLKNGTALPEAPEFRSFSVFDHLPSSEFVARSVYKNRHGQLFFGSTNGYFVFDPANIKNNPVAPDIVFTDLRVNNLPVRINTPGSPLEKDIGVTTRLELTRTQNVFTIGFAALNFIEPENNRYAYRLEGFDKEWNDAGHQQTATYTNLDPGTYTFRVRASNNDGLWNEKGVSLEIVILPAWWQTWIAKSFYAAVFVIAIFFFRKNTIISVNLKNELWREHVEKQKLEELAQMKQQFFANVSHEIRTPLTLILGPLNKLMKQEKQIPELATVFRNSSRLKMLVDQFLDFSKMESHRMTLAPVRTEIRELTRHILTNFSDYAGQRNIELKLEMRFSKCVVMIDADKYEKILTNLLSNAVKSISGKGSVTARLEYDEALTHLLVHIIDTGRGITPEESGHIFERYYSGANHLASSSGTGIGLYLTRELVELQKGTIAVDSTVGKGSAFTVTLPLTVMEFEAGHEEVLFNNLQHPATEKQPGSSLQFEHTILVVDDNPDMCDYVESILCGEFNVIKENDPLQCIDKVITCMPDLVISDVMMPGMDGFQLCKLLKEDIRFSHIPVILLTAKATKSDHIIGYETGADDYVYKPFDEEILSVRVKNLVTRLKKLKQHFVGHDGILHPGARANALDVKFMEDVLAEIRQHCLDPDFNVNRIIEKIGMSRSLFYKKFKSLSDQSIADLIRTFRLKKAATLLSNGNLTVSQVAYDCGFTDPAYFSRVFKEYFNVSPKDYPAHRKTG